MKIARLAFAFSLLWSLGACSRSNPAFSAGDRCGPASMSTFSVVCGAGTTCDPAVGVCICPASSALCGEACVDVRTDGANCGACGLSCPAGQACAQGRCSGGGCPTSALDCGGACIDPATNAAHCGGCAGAAGKSCGGGETCVTGVCTKAPCPFGATLCGGACVDTASSAKNCGGCGQTCAAGAVCSAGACAAACPTGTMACGTSCVDLKHDATNCGSCGTVCANNQICAAEGGTIKCRDYKYAGCLTCPCSGCNGRSCCQVPATTGGYSVLCVEDSCPLP